MTMRIADMRPGDRARIIGYSRGDKEYRRKLLAMGLTRGVEIDFVKRAPLGDPVEIRVRGFSLTLRRHEAESLELEPINTEAHHAV